MNSKGIEYLVIGGYAVGYHGYPRATGDMDVWVAIHERNAAKLTGALREFGFDLPELKESLFLTTGKIIRMGVPPIRLEILTSIDGLDFEVCYKNRIVAEIEGVKVNFISKGDLLINKRASGRFKDLDDIEKLQE